MVYICTTTTSRIHEPTFCTLFPSGREQIADKLLTQNSQSFDKDDDS